MSGPFLEPQQQLQPGADTQHMHTYSHNASNLADEAVLTLEATPEATTRPLKRRLLSVLWDSFDKSPEERAFLHKIDLWILLYVSLAYFIKYLDQTNVTNAYVSGMKDDLNMHGNQFNMLQTMFTIGYCLGNIPSQLAMTAVRPSIWLPSLELIWSILVLCMSATHSLRVLYTLRFLIGLLEASAYPGILTLLGNWYTPSELGKRAALFYVSSCLAQMFSGYLQASLYAGMHGRAGLAAWQWLFVFDAILGLPVAVFGFVAIPDSPTTSRAYWLTPAERTLAVSRMRRVGRQPLSRMTRAVLRDVVCSWPVYLFGVVFAAQLLGNRIYNYFAIYLQSTGRYSVEQVNIIPSGGFALQAVLTLVYAWTSDLIGRREPVIAVAASISFLGAVILCVWPEQHHGLMLLGWFLTYAQGGSSALLISYINELLSFSAEQRLVVIGIVETFGFIMNAWVILLVYPSGKAPDFPIGYPMTALFFAVEIVGVLAIQWCTRRWKPGPGPTAEMIPSTSANP